MHDSHSQRILIEPLAPAKPRLGAPCNGCGICCLSAPCPLGILLSRRRQGACAALRWRVEVRQYRCGALVDTVPLLRDALPRPLRWAAARLAPIFRVLARRWIASGIGCDSNLEVAAADAAPAVPAPHSAAPRHPASFASKPLPPNQASCIAKP